MALGGAIGIGNAYSASFSSFRDAGIIVVGSDRFLLNIIPHQRMLDDS